MNTPVKWLNEYVNLQDISFEDLCEEMIMSGSNIESTFLFGHDIEKIVVGKILSIEKHPSADKLVVTQTDVGKEVVQIITGATNVSEGDYVPVILPGGKLPDGRVIEKGRLRGLESFGMMCSFEELGYGEKAIPQKAKDGIWILDKPYELGATLNEALGFQDKVIEFEITSNRPDCLSILGIAREAAAIFNKPLKYPDTQLKNEVGQIEDYAKVHINDETLCRRYVAKVVKDVEIKESPWWMQQHLMNAGVRPINNIVDITNYVMLEYGQPLHAFDLAYVDQNTIIVDRAKKGEGFTTLDDTERTLNEHTLMIRDASKSIGIAGVMGGLNSEIRDTTTEILIEGASFLGENIRSTSKQLGLRTEASTRFEKGIDPNLAIEAVNRVCHLIQQLNCGTVIKGTIDVYPNKKERHTVNVRIDRMNQILGTQLKGEEMAEIFNRLEMETEIQSDEIKVKPPTVRQDLNKEIDFSEELARIYGYGNLDSTLHKDNLMGGKNEKQQFETLVKSSLSGLGFDETQTYSFVAPKGLDKVCYPEDSDYRKTVVVENPLGEETSIMRTSLLPNALDLLERNASRKNPEAKIYELGRVFFNLKNETEPKLPVEWESLVMTAYGKALDFYSLKGDVETFFSKIGLTQVTYEPESNNQTYHPGRCAKIKKGDEVLGYIGQIHPDVQENYAIKEAVYGCELDFEKIKKLKEDTIIYKPIPKYPAVFRDLALVVKEDIYVSAIETIIKEAGGPLLEKVALFDIYTGTQVAEGFKSVAFSLQYRHVERTLTDEEVNQVNEQILKALKDKLKAELRI